jgi:hypothetical protein
LQGKIVHGGKLNGNKEESKKEETLTVGEANFARAKEFQPASQEKRILRGVSISRVEKRSLHPKRLLRLCSSA